MKILNFRLLTIFIVLTLILDSSTILAQESNLQNKYDSLLNIITGAQISSKKISLLKLGAIGDGKTDCKPAFDKAMEMALKQGGLHIIVPKGEYQVKGPIHMQSNVCIELQEGAQIRFLSEPELYLPIVDTSWEGTFLKNYSPFIYGYNLHDVAIIGKGTINGDAGSTFALWREDQKESQALSRKMNHEEVPKGERIFGSGYLLRPQLIQFYNCKNITLEDFFITNSPFWCVHLLKSQNIICRGLRYDAKLVNNDGIDPECSQDILIENVDFDNGDDNIAIKSCRDNDGWAANMPSKNIIIRNCRFKGLHAVVLGSEMSSGIENVFVKDCTYAGYCKRGIYIKTNADRGGYVRNLYVKNCSFDEVEDLFYVTSMYAGEGLSSSYFPVVENLYVDSLYCNKAKEAGLVLQGTTFKPIKNVSFKNVEILEVKNAISFDNTLEVTIENSHLGGKAGIPSQVTSKDNLFK